MPPYVSPRSCPPIGRDVVMVLAGIQAITNAAADDAVLGIEIMCTPEEQRAEYDELLADRTQLYVALTVVISTYWAPVLEAIEDLQTQPAKEEV